MPAAMFRRRLSHRWVSLAFAFVGGAVFCCAPRASAQNHPEDNTLHKLNESVDALIRKVSPSVVQILVAGYGPVDESHGNANVVIGRQRAIGSGFVIDPSGYIITNAHVVSGAQPVQVLLSDPNTDGSIESTLSTRSNIVNARIVGVARDIEITPLQAD